MDRVRLLPKIDFRVPVLGLRIDQLFLQIACLPLPPVLVEPTISHAVVKVRSHLTLYTSVRLEKSTP